MLEQIVCGVGSWGYNLSSISGSYTKKRDGEYQAQSKIICYTFQSFTLIQAWMV
jgi:hypothetical protein